MMNSFKKILAVIVSLVVLVAFCACGAENDSEQSNVSEKTSSEETSAEYNSSAEPFPDPSVSKDDIEGGKYADPGELKIRLFKIGQADAILFRTETKVILMDTGEDEDGTKILEYLAEKGLTTIDCMIITHFDKSAIGSADTILKSNAVTVKSVYEPDYVKESDYFTDYRNALSAAGVTPIIVKDKVELSFDDVDFTIYPAEKDFYAEDEDNDFSLVTSVKHKSNTFLFAADAMNDRIAEIMAMGDITHTFLKVPYNGRLVANSIEFINAVKPAHAAITCSDKNPANSEIIAALESIGAKVYLTQNGNIKVTSDGDSITVVV